MCTSAPVVQKLKLFTPHLEEVATFLNEGLKENFETVEVTVENCPDLTQEPFYLAAPGINGVPSVADIGGVPYLSPLPRLDKPDYSLLTLAKSLDYEKGHVLGAGAAPFRETEGNCELMPNFYFETAKGGQVSELKHNTHSARVTSDGGYKLFKHESTNCSLLANVLISKGLPGKVLKVVAKKRIGSDNFPESIQKVLRKKYAEKPMSVGGVFLLKSGKAKLHVMPDFSTIPLNSDEEVNQWLKFYEMNPTLICLSVFHTTDPGLGLRMEHTHCFSKHGDGGHYHYDTTPDTVEYEGYFVLAEWLHRVDAP